MDWFQILLLVVFFGLPLLGQLLEKRAPPQEPTGEPWEDAPVATLPVPARGRGEVPEWEPWMEQAQEDVEEEPDEESIHTLEAVSLEPVAAEAVVVRTERPLPSTVTETAETLEVDWTEERRHFHARYADGAAPATGPADTLAARLRHPGELRHAVLLAEILGPPKSLRE